MSTVNEWQRLRQEGTPKCVQITMLQVYLSAKLRMLSGIQEGLNGAMALTANG